MYVDTRQTEDQGHACIYLHSILRWKSCSACSGVRAYEIAALVLDGRLRWV